MHLDIKLSIVPRSLWPDISIKQVQEQDRVRDKNRQVIGECLCGLVKLWVSGQGKEIPLCRQLRLDIVSVNVLLE